MCFKQQTEYEFDWLSKLWPKLLDREMVDTGKANEKGKAKKVYFWLAAAIGAAIVSTIVSEFWGLIKGGNLFDALDDVAEGVQNTQFVRTDLVDAQKQSIAQWILAICVLLMTVAVIVTRTIQEGIIDIFVNGIMYGFVLGVGVLFILSAFDRYEDVYLAIGKSQIVMAGSAIVIVILRELILRFTYDRRWVERLVRENREENDGVDR
ncbi:hypothetical protein [Roseibium sp.]|uniref:hypothetical protein n=1 Tax=Roseibium sp. TaxID=1936156 RepID=UPI0039F09C3B